ncbi:MAG: YbaK/EbsC family protein [Clostridia bacterium]|nr:YbaK/EbsC family protein [Clostridia bacterium]
MSIERVKAYFASQGMAQRVLEFETSSATVELAAQAVGYEPSRIAKSLTFKLDDGAVMIVAAGDARVDNKKYKACFAQKAKMLTPEEAVALVGHAVGGVCPFAVKEGVRVFLDESLRRFETVYPACGSANSAIELSIAELETHSGSIGWVDVCKDWE